MSADADLDRTIGIDNAVTHGPADEGAMVETLPVVGPGVLMGVELDEGERPVLGGVRPEQRPSHEMVAAEADEKGAGFDDLCRLLLDCRWCLLVVSVVEEAIAVVDNRKRVEEIAVEG